MAEDRDRLLGQIRACRICVEKPLGRPLPHEPRPVAVLSGTARLLICGQAPGTRVHASGKPFTDPSGERLREWLGIGPEIFYDSSRVAILPMGFCFPGQDAKGGDLPPRRECAPAWRARAMAAMPQVELVLAIGIHAQKWHLGEHASGGLTRTVAGWRSILAMEDRPAILPLPHPSWRNNAWLARNPWFAQELLPVLRARVAALV